MSNMTENDYLEMADHFKKTLNEKNELIKKLQKKIMISYAFFVVLDIEIEGYDIIERGRTIMSEALDELIFYEE